MSIELVMPSNPLMLCHPLLLPPSIFPSIRVFSNESVLLIRWPKCWSFSFSIVLPMNIQDWFPLGLAGLISLQSKGLSGVFSNTWTNSYASSFQIISSGKYVKQDTWIMKATSGSSWFTNFWSLASRIWGITLLACEWAQFFGSLNILWPPDAKNWLNGKDPDAGKDWRWEEKGTTEDEMVGWHHRLNGHEFE